MAKDLFFKPAPEEVHELYLDMVKRSLVNWIYGDSELALVSDRPLKPAARIVGKGWPSSAHTMIGLRRLENIQSCVETVLKDGVPGDLLEAGVWRGGATILMRAVLQAYQVKDRCVWAVDSFEGMPPPNPEKYPHDAGLFLNQFPQLGVSLEQVQENFARYGLLDERVRFLKGWFRDTLPTAPIQQLAVLRVDADLYESTMDSLKYLYPRLAVGGFAIIDDYSDIPACRQAVTDYRQAQGIEEEIIRIDWTGVYWRRTR